MTLIKTYPVYSLRFCKAYVVQMRPYLLFVSGIAGVTGMAVSYTNSVPWWKLFMGFAVFFSGYGFGQALTDSFQTDTDKLSAPYRPLSKGIITVKAVLAVSIIGLLLCAVALFVLHSISFLLSGLAVCGLATYSYIKRNVWALGPFYNAWIVALLPVMGYFALVGREVTVIPGTVLPIVLVSFFSYASFVLIGYLKDIDADRATGYKVFPVVWGWKKTVFAGDLFAVATLGIFWLSFSHNLFETVSGVMASVIILAGQIKGHMAKRENEMDALFPILATVRSFILFHIAIVLHFQPGWWLAAIFYYALFEVFLFRRPSKYQV